MEILGIHHIALITANYEKAKEFYCGILGFEVIAENYREARQSWKCDLAIKGLYVLELFSFPNPPPKPKIEPCGLRHLAFKVLNVEKTRAELLAKAVECEEIRIDEYTNKKFFFIHDPDNVPLEFYEQ